ncbi:hypothetical protein [Brevundimonas nasdae]|jgi:hypothetical protein
MQTTTKLRLVRIGSAKRATRADSETGFMEQIQIFLWDGQPSAAR